ncbi:MAG: YihY/virulence factor BrkB family protein [Bryobacteraceae bacterium]
MIGDNRFDGESLGQANQTAAGGSQQDANLITALRFPEIKKLLGTALKAWFEHNAPRLGASLAFYTILSLAPLLIVVIAVAGLIFGREAAESQVVWQIQDLVGRQGAEVVRQMISGARRPASGLLATTLGLLFLLFGATTVVADLRDALNTIWDVPSREGGALGGVLRILNERLFYLAIILGVGLLLLASLIGNAWLAPTGWFFRGLLPLPVFLQQAVSSAVSFLVITGLFSLVYKVMPDVSLEWRDVAPGAVFTSLLFLLGKNVIGLYLVKTSIASTFGPAGPLVVLLVWVYFSAQIFFLGAEVTQVFARNYGSRRDAH